MIAPRKTPPPRPRPAIEFRTQTECDVAEKLDGVRYFCRGLMELLTDGSPLPPGMFEKIALVADRAERSLETLLEDFAAAANAQAREGSHG
jgi:hypothetical protein